MLGRIAVHLRDDPQCERRIDTAFALARAHQATVIGVCPMDNALGHYHTTVLPQEARAWLANQSRDGCEQASQLFLDKAAQAEVKTELRQPKGIAEEMLSLHARFCDLLIMSKSTEGEESQALGPNLLVTTIMGAGRPVLVLPNYTPMDTIGKRVLYCWDQKRESARAFTDATPFLQNCESLTVLEIDRNDQALTHNDIHEDDIIQYCVSRNYPTPTHLVKRSHTTPIGNVILNTASDIDADLIVMGAYGHSRLRQWILGGASRTMLSSLTVPVLMAQ